MACSADSNLSIFRAASGSRSRRLMLSMALVQHYYARLTGLRCSTLAVALSHSASMRNTLNCRANHGSGVFLSQFSLVSCGLRAEFVVAAI